MSKRPRRGRSSGSLEQANKQPRTDDSIVVLSPAGTRDPQYYYEDGSVVLLVDDTLFKVQASLLKAQSETFRDMFTSLSGDVDAKVEGLSDECPIKISNVTVPEFRNLLMIFYAPPSDRLFLGMQGTKNAARAWKAFIALSDVVRLADRFGMEDIETWAAGQLKSLVKSSATLVVTGARKETGDGIPTALVLALQYAIAIEDTPLVHNLRSLVQYYCAVPTKLSAPVLEEFFRHPELYEKDFSLFGFLFITLLNLGHDGWDQECFTREDRIAFFSAQSYLTPLPRSLAKNLSMPLTTKPPYVPGGDLEVFGEDNCSQNCRRRLSLAWKAAFDSSYYRGVTSSEAMKPTIELEHLPCLRFKFADAVCTLGACKKNCGNTALRLLDEDISKLFVRLAGYYRDIN
ncbi:hypothetical protein FRC12_002263 [Ceratobasidium sp. 428]|nr:hypothetical protein FRC12_002263 [Ceratobasidium sp. 428]